MITLDLSTSDELHLVIDPIDAEDRIPSVAFNIEARFTTLFQQTTILIKRCWFSHVNLCLFEKELKALRDQAGSAILRNMSDDPIITIKRDNDKVTTRIQSTTPSTMSKVSLEVAGKLCIISNMLDKIQEYPKWW